MHCMFVYDLRQWISTNVLTEALYDKKQSTATCDPEFARLQAQVGKLESASAEKDARTAEFEAIVKKSEGEAITIRKCWTSWLKDLLHVNWKNNKQTNK